MKEYFEFLLKERLEEFFLFEGSDWVCLFLVCSYSFEIYVNIDKEFESYISYG